ncbi:hypothetical protein PG993_006528 [Apiospora rasikravindrae]|uniref:Uncharacterized protein n=1 Tax=Apiospora rasikravindrae TaxID=990691 RepID=A0ABR1T7R2_9PEZI
MPSSDSGGPSAADIITHVGVPLAMAGVLPVAYSVTTTLIFQRKVQKQLDRSQAGVIRSTEILNSVVEIHLPRYRLAAPDATDGLLGPRVRPGDIYPRSRLPGRTWTFLTWHRQEVGTKVQRSTPGDEPRQPQAEIRFYDLIDRLYRLGAKPDPSGWEELRTRGTWIRRGLVLMRIGSSDALLIAASDAPDGFLTLRLGPDVDWQQVQHRQGITFPEVDSIILHTVPVNGQSIMQENEQNPNDSPANVPIGNDPSPSAEEEDQETSTARGGSKAQKVYSLPILCRFSDEGLALTEEPARARLIDQKEDRVRSPLAICGSQKKNYITEADRYHVNLFYPADNKRFKGAFSSPRWDIQRVAEYGVSWMQWVERKLRGLSGEDIAVIILYNMVVDPLFAAAIYEMLVRWKVCTDNGEAMPIEYTGSVRTLGLFAETSLLLSFIARLASEPRFSMQSCVETFKYVKLG